MNRFNYYKRVVGGEVVELHMHENRENCVVSKIYPIPVEEGYYKMSELHELDDCNAGIFDGMKLEPNYIGD